ncbi:MAG: ABC transporter permease [Vicinamibacteria bacterium]
MTQSVTDALPLRARIAARLRDNETVDLWRRTFSYRSGKLGLILLGFLMGLAFVGPLFAPHGESEIVGIPYTPPSLDFPMGTDVLGRDALSRFLHGGDTVIVLSFLSTALGYIGGISIGLISGYNRGRLDLVLMRVIDVALAFPSLILVLVLVAGLGPQLWLVVVGIAFTHMPRVARVVRGATQEVTVRSFVELAEARGERMPAILSREILPNIWTPILADFGIRLSTSVILIASLSFLGFGLQPPAADWALMVNENRPALTLQPYAVVFPVIAIGLLTIAVNLAADAFARAAGRSLDRRELYT